MQSLHGFLHFNPRSHEGSDVVHKDVCRSILYFNPRSHEGSDLSIVQMFKDIAISIHAPTKGATVCKYRLLLCCLISIHAPTKGATLYAPSISYRRLYFNPRSHEGSDFIAVYLAESITKFQSTLPRRERLSVNTGCFFVV